MHGIDLGGSYARIAWPDPAGRTATGAAVPATVHVAGPGDLRVSRAWGALSARSRLFAGATEDSVGPQELTACVLAALAQRSLAGGGDLPQTVALAVPAAARTGPGGATGNGMEPALRSAVTRAGLTVGQVLPEPVATALHYETIREGANLSVLVYDQGATSSDLTLLAIDADRTVRVLESRTEPIGGDRWDEAIAGELLRRLGSPEASAGPLLRVAEQLRLALGTVPVARQPVPWEDGDREVSLDRQTFEQLVEPIRAQSLASVDALLTSVRERGLTEPQTLLLAGGLSATPGMAEWFEQRLGILVESRTPEAAVANGLALAEDFGLLQVLTGSQATASRPRMAKDPEPPRVRAAERVTERAGERVTERAVETEDPEPNSGRTAGPTRPFERPRPPEREPVVAPIPEPTAEPTAEREPTFACTDADPSPSDESSVPDPGTPVTLHPHPVEQLRATRRDDHLLVVWAWPPDGREARVRWRLEGPALAGRPQAGDLRCPRRVYEHDGGLDLTVGRGAITLTVEVLVPRPPGPLTEAAALSLPARPPLVRYAASVHRDLPDLRSFSGLRNLGGLRGRTARLAFTAETACLLPALQVVHGLGRSCPSSAKDGTVLRELPAQRLEAQAPFTVELPFPPTRGASWLVCLPIAPDDNAVELRPTALHRLRVT